MKTIGRKLIPEHPFITAAQEAYKLTPMSMGYAQPDFIFQQGFIKGIQYLQAINRAEMEKEITPTLFLQKENDVVSI